VHGHLDRLEALLKQEGFLDRCEECDGSGTYGDGYDQDCPWCQGLGWIRLRTDVTIVQLGDLGHFGRDASPTGDILCYKYVTDNRWADIVLWGNHDRALVDPGHAFNGFLQNYEVMHYIQLLRGQGRMRLAYEAHDFLITHAGLALAFKDQKVNDGLKTDPAKLADWLNTEDEKYLSQWLDGAVKNRHVLDYQALAIRDAIGTRRGGRVNVGGILWRDINEKLYDGFRQVFGHSADSERGQVRYCTKAIHTRKPLALGDMIDEASYCIDVGG
jgi:hypothetical protein